MSRMEDAKNNPLKQFWDMLDIQQSVMLGSPVPHQAMQPMAANGSREEGLIWFYTGADTDLAEAARNGGKAQMCVMDHSQSYYAAVIGSLSTHRSEQHIDRYWNAITSAWYPDGKQDPNLTMLKFAPESAAIWIGSNNPVRFGWEIARSAISGDEPNVGFSTLLTFSQQAA